MLPTSVLREPPPLLGRAAAITSAAGTILLAGLVPKCPLCIAAALSAWGVGAAAAGAIAPAVRPLLSALGLVVLAAALAKRGRARVRRSASRRRCCSA